MNASNPYHNCCREVGLIPFPFCSNGSPWSWYTAIASRRRSCFSVNISPFSGISETSAMTYVVIGIILPLTLVCPSCKFYRNLVVISMSNPCNLCKYGSQPDCWRMVWVASEIGKVLGSFKREFSPMAHAFYWANFSFCLCFLSALSSRINTSYKRKINCSLLS